MSFYIIQDLQTDQLGKIRDLESQVRQMREHHTERIQQMKSDFLREKKDYQHDSDFRISSLEKKANKVILRVFK